MNNLSNFNVVELSESEVVDANGRVIKANLVKTLLGFEK